MFLSCVGPRSVTAISSLPPERRIEFRVGIHLGDVVEEADGDLMGDGVNIAARLEGIAKPANPRFSTSYFSQAASLALAGRQEEAQPIVQRLLDLEPGFRLRLLFEVSMAQAVADRLAEGGRMLGLPE